jgi:hypothetical protein
VTVPQGGDEPVHVQGGLTANDVGKTRVYQIQYRDTVSFCTSATFNYTNAVRVLWMP